MRTEFGSRRLPCPEIRSAAQGAVAAFFSTESQAPTPCSPPYPHQPGRHWRCGWFWHGCVHDGRSVTTSKRSRRKWARLGATCCPALVSRG